MPVINSFDVLKHLKNSPLYWHVPVVVLTTSNNQADIDRAYDLGANSYICKPINHQSLVNMDEQIRLYWFTLTKIPSHRTN